MEGLCLGHQGAASILKKDLHDSFHPNEWRQTGVTLSSGTTAACNFFPSKCFVIISSQFLGHGRAFFCLSCAWSLTCFSHFSDAWSLYAQIGVFPRHPPKNPQPISDCEQIFDWDTGYLNPKLKPENNQV